MTFHINWEWNVIIPTVTRSIIFQRGWLKPPRSKVFPWVPESFPLWNTPRNSGGTGQVPTLPSVPTTTTGPGTWSATARRLRPFRYPPRSPAGNPRKPCSSRYWHGKIMGNQGNYGNHIQNNQVEWENLDLTWFNHHFMGFTTGYNGFYR